MTADLNAFFTSPFTGIAALALLLGVVFGIADMRKPHD